MIKPVKLKGVLCTLVWVVAALHCAIQWNHVHAANDELPASHHHHHHSDDAAGGHHSERHDLGDECEIRACKPSVELRVESQRAQQFTPGAFPLPQLRPGCPHDTESEQSPGGGAAQRLAVYPIHGLHTFVIGVAGPNAPPTAMM